MNAFKSYKSSFEFFFKVSILKEISIKDQVKHNKELGKDSKKKN